MDHELEGYLHHAFSLLNSSEDPSDLTVGVEQECFLFDGDGITPVTHYQSQTFLKKVSQAEGWHIQSVEDTPFGSALMRVSRNSSRGTYTALKYDHHPHLLEVAFEYSDSLIVLDAAVRTTLATLEWAAKATGLKLLHQPLLALSPLDERVMSPLSEFKNLRHYRELLLRKRGARDITNLNYAAVIAATQTHIGGTGWWKRPEYVAGLYRFEPSMLAYGLSGSAGDKESLLRLRWSGYADVFNGFPLVGFPSVNTWSITKWVEAMLDSPLYGGPEEPWAGSTLRQLKRNPFAGWQTFLKAVRDLQIVRPKLYGTLEFRADPAQRDADHIIALAALRLGLCAALLKEKPRTAPQSFASAHEAWWKAVRSGKTDRDPVILAIAAEGLVARGRGEERFLEPLGAAPAKVKRKAVRCA